MENRYVHIKLSASHLERIHEAARTKEERGAISGIRHFHRPMTGAYNAFFTGSVGEVVTHDYLSDANDSGMMIETPNDPTVPEVADIVAGGHYIDVKTRQAKYPFRDGYTMFAEKGCLEHGPDYLAFVWYDRRAMAADILGFVETGDIGRKGRLYLKGERLDNGWQMPCDSYGIRIRDLDDIRILPQLLRENGNVRGRTSDGAEAAV